VCLGDAASFTVDATAFLAPITYQWRKDGNDIPGATSSTFSIPATVASDGGVYDVKVIDGCGSKMSASALLDFTGAVVTTHPTNQNVSAGDAAGFFVTGTGTGTLTYQWRKDGVPLFPPQTDDLLLIFPVQVSDVGFYDCIITDQCGPGQSNTALLSCKEKGKGFGNEVPNLQILKQPESSIICDGGSHTLSVVAVGESLSYVWRKGGSPIAPPETNSTLVLNPIVIGDGASYDVIVSDVSGSILSDPAVLDHDFPPAITLQPVNQSAHVGDTVTYTVAASGEPVLHYQWRKGGLQGPLFDIPGADDTSFTILSVVPASAGRYQCRVTNHCGSVLSNTAKLTLIL
jgi:hypothetical protein